MQCVQFETRLNELLDERLSPELEPAIGWHAGECGSAARHCWRPTKICWPVSNRSRCPRRRLIWPCESPANCRGGGSSLRRAEVVDPGGGRGPIAGGRRWRWAAASKTGTEPHPASGTDVSVAMQTAAQQVPSPRARWRPACRRMPCPQARGRQSLGRQSLGRQRPPARESFRFGWLRITKALTEDFSVRPRLPWSKWPTASSRSPTRCRRRVEALRRSLPAGEATSHSS